MKSRLLYLAAFDPFPPIGGGRLRVYNLLKNLLETFDIRLICLSEAHDSSQVDDFMTGRVDRVYYDRSRFKGVQGMLMGTPYEVAMFENQELRQKIEDTVKDWDPHIIWFSRTAMLQYLENLEVDGKVVLLDQHDLSRKLWRMMREGSTNLAARIVAAVNYFLIRLFEENVYRRLDLCFSVSAVEALETESFCGEDVNVTIVPNGVDIKRYSPSPQSRGESIVI
ncbi:MAG: glycosyltransferase, partial [Pseudomonadales bacterium]|nr:glycosyltransferase [Pseudomonadales bacterium]